MKVYANLYALCTAEFDGEFEFEVLNELKDLTSRNDSNCLYHTRFLFECDNTPLEDQEDRAYSLRADEVAVRATFSGSKSIHVILEFEKALEPYCRKYYKEIWAACNKLFFNNEADKACANPARLTRRPGAIRTGGIRQKCLYDMPENVIMHDTETWKLIWRLAKGLITMKALNANDKTQIVKKNDHNGMCANYDVVQYYLKKSFPNIKGNGDSSISLFKAVRCCMKYGDKTTLDSVLRKARNERWTEHELDHLIRNMSKYI